MPDSTLEGVRKESEGIIETVADKGYGRGGLSMINIMFVSDEGYSSKLFVAFSSLLKNNLDIIDELFITIRTNNLSQTAIMELHKCAEKYCLDINRINIVYMNELDNRLKELQIKPFKNNYLAYYKILDLDEIQGERLLVIDCDVLIYSGIINLYGFDLHDKVAGAVLDVAGGVYMILYITLVWYCGTCYYIRKKTYVQNCCLA